MKMICETCDDTFDPGDADDGLCPWDDTVLIKETDLLIEDGE